jgi:hypoxanthine phosphoribosyltransferase
LSDFTHLEKSVVGEILIDEKRLEARINELQQEIERDYAGKQPLMIAVLRGSFLFFADLTRGLKVDCTMEFMRLSSYEGRTTSGQVVLHADISDSVAGRDVVIVEDIVDTGLTTAFLVERLYQKEAASIEICTLLDKSERRQTDIKPKYVGFSIPNKFVVGYGLDKDQRLRHLPYVGVVKGGI